LTGQLDILKFLVSNYHVDVDEKNCDRLTSLHHAAASGSIQLVHALVGLHATVNARSKTGLTPLHMACKHNHGPIVGYLVSKAFADTLALTDEGEMPKDLTKNSAIVTFLNGVLSVPSFTNNSIQSVEVINSNNLIMSDLLSQLKKNLFLLKKAEKAKVASNVKSISIREVNKQEKFSLLPVPPGGDGIPNKPSGWGLIRNTVSNREFSNNNNNNNLINSSNSTNLNSSSRVSVDPLKDMRRQLRGFYQSISLIYQTISFFNTIILFLSFILISLSILFIYLHIELNSNQKFTAVKKINSPTSSINNTSPSPTGSELYNYLLLSNIIYYFLYLILTSLSILFYSLFFFKKI
jgi:ankyrin repeat protein